MASSILGSVTQVVSPPKFDEKAGDKYIQGIFNQPVPWYAHVLLTGIFPFPALKPFVSLIPGVGPFYDSICTMLLSVFYTLGQYGGNLIVSGSKGWAVIKAATTLLIKGFLFFLNIKYPGQWWIPYLGGFLEYANPWITWDMITPYSKRFPREGYTLPFLNKKCVNANLEANRTTRDGNQIKKNTALQQAINAEKNGTQAPASPELDCLPKVLEKGDIGFNIPQTNADGTIKKDLSGNNIYKEDPITKKRLISFGHVDTAVIGLLCVPLVPWYFEISKGIPPEIKVLLNSWVLWAITMSGLVLGSLTVITVGGITAIPSLLPTILSATSSTPSTPSTPNARSPSGATQSGGRTKLPSMNEIIYNVLDETEDENSFEQSGGGEAIDKEESAIFLGSLVFVSLLGIGFAVIRDKKKSPGTV